MRVVLVTGAARGIGRAIADNLATDHDIALTYLTAKDEAAEFAVKHPAALCLHADLTKTDAPELIEKVIAQFGRLDVLVNNAGLVLETPLDNFDIADANTVMHTNAIAPLALIAAASEHMKPGSSIINITSINATKPPAGAIAYAASKAALEAITIGCAKALGPKGIRVNAVCPGAIERSHSPRSDEIIKIIEDDSALGRMALESDIADAVRFLASDKAAAITGETLTVSAGYRL